MSESIFDWDDDEEKQEEDLPLAVEQAPPVDEPPILIPPPEAPGPSNSFQTEINPLELGPSPFETRQLEPPVLEPAVRYDEPAGSPYSSDPFDEPATPPETITSPSPYEAGPNGFDPLTSQTDTSSQYPFGYQPDPFLPGSQQAQYDTGSQEETSRRSGLAFSAGIVFFSSVVFMLFLGWIADWLIGSSPWGLVGGIIVGSILGLIQFVRITSRIFIKDKSGPAMRPLMPPDEDEADRF